MKTVTMTTTKTTTTTTEHGVIEKFVEDDYFLYKCERCSKYSRRLINIRVTAKPAKSCMELIYRKVACANCENRVQTKAMLIMEAEMKKFSQ